MFKKSSLGRGLDALLAKPTESTQSLAVSLIVAAGYQPRQHFDAASLADLAASIQSKGILQPLLVRPVGNQYEIVAGERRWRAAQMVGLSEVPVIIRELADYEALEIAIIENLQRENLGPLEEAQAYRALENQQRSAEQIAEAVGKSVSAVKNTLRLLNLPAEVQQALNDNQITAGHARALLSLPEADRLWGLEQVLSRGLNVRQAEVLKREKAQLHSVETAKKEPYQHLELELTRFLGVKVRLQGKAERGRLELSYSSAEELQSLLDRLGYQDLG